MFSRFFHNKPSGNGSRSIIRPTRTVLAVFLALVLATLLTFRNSFFTPRHDAVMPTLGPAVRAVSATGTVESSAMLPLASPVTARLKFLMADEGSLVNKGDILAKLEDERGDGNLKSAIAGEEFARKEYERNLALFKNRAISIQTLQSSKRDLAAAIAEADSARAQQRDVTLIAPQKGVIIKRDGEIGELIPTQQAILWIADTSTFRASAEVDEEDVALLKPGQRVLMKADAFAEQIFTGELLQVTPKGDPISRSYRVRVSLPNPQDLLIGMTLEMNIIIEERKDTLLLPKSSIVSSKGRASAAVWIWRDGRVKRQPVTVGIEGDSYQEIREGVDTSDTVLKEPPVNLQEGSKVRIQLLSSDTESTE